MALGGLDCEVSGVEPGAEEGAPTGAFGWLLAQDLAFPVARTRLLDEFKRAFVARALACNSGNITRAAAASGLARRYFQILRASTRSEDDAPR
jgi:hypothetical protein